MGFTTKNTKSTKGTDANDGKWQMADGKWQIGRME
jgi:hypothetical protein